MRTHRHARSDERGFSILETLIGLLILSTAVLSLVAATGFSTRMTATSRRDLQWWAALQWKADSLMGVDSASIKKGSDVVNGYPIAWEVRPGTVKRVEIVIGGGESILNGRAVSDTLVVYLGS